MLAEDGTFGRAETAHTRFGDEVAYGRRRDRDVEVRAVAAKTDERGSGVVLLNERSEGRYCEGEWRGEERFE